MATYTDNFNRSNETLETSANWAKRGSGGASVASNTLAGDFIDGISSVVYQHQGTYTDDQYATCKIMDDFAMQNGHGAVRVQDASPGCYFVRYQGGLSVDICKVDAGGTVSQLATQDVSGSPPAVGDILGIEAEGTTLRAKVNGVTVVSTTDATFSTGSPGVAANTDFDLYLDDWEGGDGQIAAPPDVVSAKINGGSDNYLSGAAPVTGAGFTFASWLYLTGSGQRQLLSLGEATGQRASQFTVSVYDDGIDVGSWDSSNAGLAPTRAALTTGQWIHLTITLTSGWLLNVFEDGVKVITNYQFDGPPTHAAWTQLRIGAEMHDTSACFSGYIGHPAFWASIVSDADIGLMAAGGNPTDYSPTVYWDDISETGPFAPAVGTGNLTEVGTIADAPSDPTVDAPAGDASSSAGEDPSAPLIRAATIIATA